jgi:hypothetical protein
MTIDYSITPQAVRWVDPETLEEYVIEQASDPSEYLEAVQKLLNNTLPEAIPEPVISLYENKLPPSDMEGAILEKWNSLPDIVSSQEELDTAYAALEKFHEKLKNNPSARSTNLLMEFMERNNVPITSNGTLLVFKRVKDDYYDCHTGKTCLYKVGTVHEVPRSKVDDDPHSACSFGLHAGGYNYVHGFYGQRILGVEVDPADVVCVPYDSSYGKIRVCKLRVVFEFDSADEMLEISKHVVAVPHKHEYTPPEREEDWADDDMVVLTDLPDGYDHWGEDIGEETWWAEDSEDSEDTPDEPVQESRADKVYAFLARARDAGRIGTEYNSASFQLAVFHAVTGQERQTTIDEDYNKAWELCEEALRM